MRFYAYHGVNPEERTKGQRFVVDVRIATDLREAGRSDDLSTTVNYSLVYSRVREIVEGTPRNLIEMVAEEIASAILDEFERAQSITVTVRKPEVAIKGSILDASGVTVMRGRSDRRRPGHE
jgi:7,8-dihydroneopterin aldolase/epimerase/oxygenase